MSGLLSGMPAISQFVGAYWHGQTPTGTLPALATFVKPKSLQLSTTGLPISSTRDQNFYLNAGITPHARKPLRLTRVKNGHNGQGFEADTARLENHYSCRPPDERTSVKL